MNWLYCIAFIFVVGITAIAALITCAAERRTLYDKYYAPEIDDLKREVMIASAYHESWDFRAILDLFTLYVQEYHEHKIVSQKYNDGSDIVLGLFHPILFSLSLAIWFLKNNTNRWICFALFIAILLMFYGFKYLFNKRTPAFISDYKYNYSNEMFDFNYKKSTEETGVETIRKQFDYVIHNHLMRLQMRTSFMKRKMKDTLVFRILIVAYYLLFFHLNRSILF